MNKTKSFTLIELLVVMAVFALVFAIAVGLFVTSLRNQRNLLARQEVMDEISYVMEYMSRAIRMAKYDESGNCIAAGKNYETTRGDNGLKFKNYKSDIECQEFYLDDDLDDKKLKEDKDGSINDLTSANLQINSFNIQLSGQSRSSDNLQPKVTLFLDVQHANESSVSLQIQTTISQRNLDYE